MWNTVAKFKLLNVELSRGAGGMRFFETKDDILVQALGRTDGRGATTVQENRWFTSHLTHE